MVQTPVPDEAFRVAGAMLRIDYLRTVLESSDDQDKPIIHVINSYDKIDPNKKIELDDGIAYVICKYEECGKKVVPARAREHLREVHGIRQTITNKIDHTNEKYFKVVVEHGTKAKEGVSVKAFRKGKKLTCRTFLNSASFKLSSLT